MSLLALYWTIALIIATIGTCRASQHCARTGRWIDNLERFLIAILIALVWPIGLPAVLTAWHTSRAAKREVQAKEQAKKVDEELRKAGLEL